MKNNFTTCSRSFTQIVNIFLFLITKLVPWFWYIAKWNICIHMDILLKIWFIWQTHFQFIMFFPLAWLLMLCLYLNYTLILLFSFLDVYFKKKAIACILLVNICFNYLLVLFFKFISTLIYLVFLKQTFKPVIVFYCSYFFYYDTYI